MTSFFCFIALNIIEKLKCPRFLQVRIFFLSQSFFCDFNIFGVQLYSDVVAAALALAFILTI